MSNVTAIFIYGLAVNALLGVIEVLIARSKKIKIHEYKDTTINILIIILNLFLNSFSYGWGLFLLQKAYSISFYKIPTSIISSIFLFIFVDFLFYWFHRIAHTLNFMYPVHVLHHTSQNMNITVAGRMSWSSYLVTAIFFLPASLVGYHPLLVKAILAIYNHSAGWYHTRIINRMGFLEKIIITPSLHRVHHGYNDIYINKNFGGFFVIWDILFKTYQKETEAVKYGVSRQFSNYNPYTLQFTLIKNYFIKLKLNQG